jgi:hypothetical protein
LGILTNVAKTQERRWNSSSMKQTHANLGFSFVTKMLVMVAKRIQMCHPRIAYLSCGFKCDAAERCVKGRCITDNGKGFCDCTTS